LISLGSFLGLLLSNWLGFLGRVGLATSASSVVHLVVAEFGSGAFLGSLGSVTSSTFASASVSSLSSTSSSAPVDGLVLAGLDDLEAVLINSIPVVEASSIASSPVAASASSLVSVASVATAASLSVLAATSDFGGSFGLGFFFLVFFFDLENFFDGGLDLLVVLDWFLHWDLLNDSLLNWLFDLLFLRLLLFLLLSISALWLGGLGLDGLWEVVRRDGLSRESGEVFVRLFQVGNVLLISDDHLGAESDESVSLLSPLDRVLVFPRKFG